MTQPENRVVLESSEQRMSIATKLARFSLAASKAERIRNVRAILENKENELSSLLTADGNEIVAPEKQVFAISYKDKESALEEVSYKKWDSENLNGTETVSVGKEFIAKKIVINIGTGETWAVSPDDSLCLQYFDCEKVEIQDLKCLT